MNSVTKDILRELIFSLESNQAPKTAYDKASRNSEFYSCKWEIYYGDKKIYDGLNERTRKILKLEIFRAGVNVDALNAAINRGDSPLTIAKLCDHVKPEVRERALAYAKAYIESKNLVAKIRMILDWH